MPSPEPNPVRHPEPRAFARVEGRTAVAPPPPSAFAAFDVLDRRLTPESPAPVGVAFSGGGDSLMALKAVTAWAARHNRPVIAFHVDHRLQAASGAWAESARQAAERLSAAYVGLSWDGPKPDTGLPAAARAARHRLIADAARAAGVRVLVIGHTADDRIEADLMRAAGHRMGELREWSPSPIWPEGRGLFHLRPLLAVRRAAIRQALAAEGETWIDDPVNQDLRSPRARARPDAALAEQSCPQAQETELSRLAILASVGVGGDIRIDRERLRSAPRAAVRALIGAATTCVGGAASPARSGRLEALTDRVLGPAPFAGVLSGAKVLAAEEIVFVRDAGEAARGGLKPLQLATGETGVWDGRFEIRAGPDPVTVARLAGHAAALPPAQRAALKALPAPVRPGLPVMIGSGGAPACPILAEDRSIAVNLLVAGRFHAACGVISKEPAT